MTSTDRLTYSPKEVAAELGCSRSQVEKLMRDGEIPFVEISPRIRRITAGDLVAFIESRRQTVKKAKAS